MFHLGRERGIRSGRETAMREKPRLRVLFTAFALTAGLTACTPVTKVWNQVLQTVQPPAPQTEAAPQPATAEATTETAEPTAEQIAAVADLNDFVTASGGPAQHPAAARIAALGDEVLAALENPAVGEAERDAILCRVLARDVDIPLIGRFAMGRFWDKADAEQRQEFLTLFKAFLVRTYAARLGGIRIDEFEVLDARQVGERDILVRSRVEAGEHDRVRADWRVRERDGRYLILDLSVEGISMAVMLRQEFASVLRRKGLDGLLSMLRERTSA